MFFFFHWDKTKSKFLLELMLFSTRQRRDSDATSRMLMTRTCKIKLIHALKIVSAEIHQQNSPRGSMSDQLDNCGVWNYVEKKTFDGIWRLLMWIVKKYERVTIKKNKRMRREVIIEKKSQGKIYVDTSM